VGHSLLIRFGPIAVAFRPYDGLKAIRQEPALEDLYAAIT